MRLRLGCHPYGSHRPAAIRSPALLRFSAADPATVNLWANSPKLQEAGEPEQRAGQREIPLFYKICIDRY